LRNPSWARRWADDGYRFARPILLIQSTNLAVKLHFALHQMW